MPDATPPAELRRDKAGFGSMVLSHARILQGRARRWYAPCRIRVPDKGGVHRGGEGRAAVKYRRFESAEYRRGRRRASRQGLDLALLDKAVELLEDGVRMPPEYKDHPLKFDKRGCRECHIGGVKSDWVLVYRKFEDALLLYLVGTGTHRELGLGG